VTTPASMIPPEQSASLVGGILRQTKNRLTRVSLLSAACVLLTGTALFVLGFVVADHYVEGGVPPGLRVVMLGLYAVGMAIAAAVLIVLPAVRRFSDVYTARLLERAHPTFHNSLVNAIQLENHRELPGSVRSALLARAAVDASHADVRRAVALDRLRQAGIVLGGASLIFVVYVILAPKPVLPSVLRAFGARIPAPTRTTIVDVEPGDAASVIIGRPVTFTARLAGRIPAEAYVHFSPDRGTTVISGQRLSLVPAGPAGPGSRDQIWQGTKAGQDVQQSTYWMLTAGDASSRWRRLTVRSLPDVTDLQVTCVYPSYTGLRPATLSTAEAADVDAVVGTQVTVEARTNVPVRDPALVVTTGTGQGDETRLPMQHVDLDATHITGQFTVLQDGLYYLRFFDRGGEPNEDPIRHAIRARPDTPPVVTLISPAADLDLGPADAMPLRGRAEDDYGISRAAIEYKRGSQSGSISLPLPLSRSSTQPTSGPANRRMSVRVVVPVAEFGARAGDVLEWRLVAWDNRVDLQGRLTSQKGLGPIRRIIVRAPEMIARNEPPTAPVSPEPSSRPTSTDTRSAQASPTAVSKGAEPSTRPTDTHIAEKSQVPGPATRPSEELAAKPPATAPSTPGTPSTQPSGDLDQQAIAQAQARESEALERFIREHQAELTKLREHLAEPESHDAEGKAAQSASPAPEPRESPGEQSPAPSTGQQQSEAKSAEGAEPPEDKGQQQDAASAASQAPQGSKPDRPQEAGEAKAAQASAEKGVKPEQASAKTDEAQPPVEAAGGQSGAETEQLQNEAGKAQASSAASGSEKAKEEAGAQAKDANQTAAKATDAVQGGRPPAGASGESMQGQQQAQGGGSGSAEASLNKAAGTKASQSTAGDAATSESKPGEDGAKKSNTGGDAGAGQTQGKTEGESGEAKGKSKSQSKSETGPSHDGHGNKSDAQSPKGADVGTHGQQAKSARDEASVRLRGAHPPQTSAQNQGKAQVSGEPKAFEQGPGQGEGTAVKDRESGARDQESGTEGQRSAKEQGQGEGTGKANAQEPEAQARDGSQDQAGSQEKGAGQRQGVAQGKGSRQQEPEVQARDGSQDQAGGQEKGEGRAQGKSKGKGKGKGEGQGQGQGVGQGQGEGSGRGQGHGQDEGKGGAQGQGSGQGEGQGQGAGQGQGQGSGQGKGEGQGQGAGEGKGHGEGQGQGQGRGQGQGEGQGQGSGQGSGTGGGKASENGQQKNTPGGSGPGAQPSAPGAGTGSGSTPGFGPGGGRTGSKGVDSSVAPQNPQLPAAPVGGGRLDTIGDVFPVIDALEEQLRNKDVDPKLLDDLGWDETRANDFVRQFRRAQRQPMEQIGASAGPRERYETTTRPSVTVERSEGASPDAAPLSARNVREPDKTNQLFEVGRQKISEEYRDYLKAYYESIARDRAATQPAR
jgi:hypothetical protein